MTSLHSPQPCPVVGVYSSKGGVGKTSVATNVAGLYARMGYRVLFVDLDPQGDAGWDLGYLPHLVTGEVPAAAGGDAARLTGVPMDGEADRGEALLRAVQSGQPIPVAPLRGVRPDLDVLPGGEKLLEVLPFLVSKVMSGDDAAFGSVRVALSGLVDHYDIVFIDFPPEVSALTRAGMAAVTDLLIVTHPDQASLAGTVRAGLALAEAASTYQEILPLGFVLSGVGAASTAIRADKRVILEQLWGVSMDDLVFATVRKVDRAAIDCRDAGLLVHEYDHIRTQGVPGLTAGKLASAASAKLAEDYLAVALAVQSRLADRAAPATMAAGG